MANTFRAAVVTPEASLFDQVVVQAHLPTHDGQRGILYQHAPLLTKLGSGVLRLQTENGEERFFVSGGYAQMLNNELTIITEHALPANDVTAKIVAAEQTKLDAITGTSAADLLARQAAADRIKAMRLAANISI